MFCSLFPDRPRRNPLQCFCQDINIKTRRETNPSLFLLVKTIISTDYCINLKSEDRGKLYIYILYICAFCSGHQTLSGIYFRPRGAKGPWQLQLLCMQASVNQLQQVSPSILMCTYWKKNVCWTHPFRTLQEMNSEVVQNTLWSQKRIDSALIHGCRRLQFPSVMTGTHCRSQQSLLRSGLFPERGPEPVTNLH